MNLSWCQSYAPAPSENESTAIYKDSSVFISWGSSVEIVRGFMDIQNPGLGIATYGLETNAIGPPDNNVVSLGDGGQAIFQFNTSIKNGPGPDFAIFENGFADHYMELAFVEVSSNGIDYYPFESVSETPCDIQLDNFSYSDCGYIRNLAGKYRVYYGTPFDLEELTDVFGIDINNITNIRITDVVGCINPGFASTDSQGNIINDPYPTPFESGGFDLDAIGVIHNNLSVQEHEINYSVFPNPADNHITIDGFKQDKKYIFDAFGILVKEFNGQSTSVQNLASGLYFIRQGNHYIPFLKN